jgi:hypothetical protein
MPLKRLCASLFEGFLENKIEKPSGVLKKASGQQTTSGPCREHVEQSARQAAKLWH